MNLWHRKDWDHNMACGGAHHMHGGNKLHCPSGSAAHKAEAEPLQAGSWQQLRGCQSVKKWLSLHRNGLFHLKGGRLMHSIYSLTVRWTSHLTVLLLVSQVLVYICLLWVQGWCPFTPLPLNMAFESSSNCKCSRWSPFCSLWGIYIYSYSCLLQCLRVREQRSPVSCCSITLYCGLFVLASWCVTLSWLGPGFGQKAPSVRSTIISAMLLLFPPQWMDTSFTQTKS